MSEGLGNTKCFFSGQLFQNRTMKAAQKIINMKGKIIDPSPVLDTNKLNKGFIVHFSLFNTEIYLAVSSILSSSPMKQSTYTKNHKPRDRNLNVSSS
jgi:hypothetical protein